MVEVAGGRLRPEQRHDTVTGERQQGQHVVALVGVEAAAGLDAREPHQGGDGDRRRERDPIEAAHAWRSPDRSASGVAPSRCAPATAA